MYKHILIPTDGSELSKSAIQHGVALAKATKAKVTSLTVITPGQLFALEPEIVSETMDDYRKHLVSFATKCLDQVKAEALAQDVSCDVMYVENDHPYQAIIDAATNQHCDLIVMASHGRRGLSAVVLGSETVKVLTHSTVPVLVYR
ncbi:universal stress protein [Methylocapsa acidiphila]|uniref:universal stress protein n=1 Tax=Methylocapsa acidiphila TaxID=133552 RepID=UPI000426313B|nr:universal stress protein [Methylocapsa acidiphila]